MPIILIQSAKFIALFLVVTFSLSFMERYHWIFALLSHFKIQYFIGGIIISGLLIYSKEYILSLTVIGIAITSYAQIRMPMAKPWLFTSPAENKNAPIFKIAQYNKYYGNKNYRIIKDNLKNYDLITMQEVVHYEESNLKNKFINTHPYSLPKGSPRANALQVFSKYEIKNLEFKKIAPEICETLGVRFEITPQNVKNPITIYTVHTEGPIGKKAKIHKAEIRGIAMWIKQNRSNNIIFIGDINTTPYAAVFHDFINTSGLNYQNYSFLPQSTWPSFFLLPIFKIPIDHILFSNNLSLLSIKSGKATKSDHNAIFAEFSLHKMTDHPQRTE